MESAYKILLVIVLLVVIFELFQALYFMIRDKGRGKRTVWALARRVAVQILLVVLVLVGYWMGWLHLHGAAPQPAGPQPATTLQTQTGHVLTASARCKPSTHLPSGPRGMATSPGPTGRAA